MRLAFKLTFTSEKQYNTCQVIDPWTS